MSPVITYILPPTDVAPGPSPGGGAFSFVPGGRALALLGVTPSVLAGAKDRLVDPNTKDFVRTPNGEWAETADSRTSMLICISVELGKSLFHPHHGTEVAERIRRGTLNSADFVKADTARAAKLLEEAGVLADLVVRIRDDNGRLLTDTTGRVLVHCQWTDLASGSPINQAFTPGA